MIRLLWKEAREKRPWLLPLAASTAVPMAFGKGLVLAGDWDAFSSWALLSMLAALLLGASSFSSELAGRTADFAFSRPISWKKLVLAKVMVGLGLIILTTILATFTFAAFKPAAYVRFASAPDLTAGAMRVALVLGVAYLIGLAGSTVLPGTVGSLLVVMIVWLSVIFDQMLAEMFHQDLLWGSGWSFFARIAGAAAGTILLARFGLTLPTSRRMARYLLVLCIASVVGLPLDFVMNPHYEPLPGRSVSAAINLSPDGRRAVVRVRRVFPIRRTARVSCYFLRYPSFTTAKIPLDWCDLLDVGSQPMWARQEALVGVAWDYLWILRMDRKGGSHGGLIAMNEPDEVCPSPDGRWVMAANYTDTGSNLSFIDIQKARLLKGVKVQRAGNYWWQSDSEVGYTDAHNVRHFLELDRGKDQPRI